jgi:hypothetical protein
MSDVPPHAKDVFRRLYARRQADHQGIEHSVNLLPILMRQEGSIFFV